jgi:hypothetical protein
MPMPVTYEIDAANGIIRTRCVGDVTLEEVLGHFRDLTQDANRPRRLDVLLDLSEETSLPESEEIKIVAYEISRLRDCVEFGTIAVVACSDALYGMLRMFQVYTEELFGEAWIFRTLPEAETWLAERREARGSQAEEAPQPFGAPQTAARRRTSNIHRQMGSLGNSRTYNCLGGELNGKRNAPDHK